MGSLDFSVVVVLGAFAGLLFVAIGYGQLVWLQRQSKSRALGEDTRSPLISTLFWICIVASAICLLRAVTSRGLPEQDAMLAGEDLFAVAVRPGLVARYETRSPVVHEGDVLIRFSSRDGEEGTLAVKSRRQILTSDLEIEKAKPAELDPELARRLDQAKQLLQDRSSRQKQVLTERDSIEREATQQRLSVDNRKFRAEQEAHTADTEMAPLKSSLEIAKSELASQEELLRQGLLSKLEVARQRDKVASLEGQIAERTQRRALLERELRAIGSLDAQAVRTYSGQGASRTQESAQIANEIANAEKAVAAAQAALEQDRPRTDAQRQKRVQQIEVQIAECDALLSGSGRKAQVLAPFEGRVGFREPSPSSPPSDNGPLLVLYRPGKITATVHLDGKSDEGQPGERGADVFFSAEEAGRDRTISGNVLSKTLSGDEEEIVVACDPPDRVVRYLAMGGSVPVRVQLKRGVTQELAFRIGIALGIAALALAGVRSVRSRFSPAAAAPGGAPGPMGTPAPVPPSGAPPFGPPGRPDPYRPFAQPFYSWHPDYPPQPQGGSYAHLPAHQAALELPTAPHLFARISRNDLSADEADPTYLRRLGARLRHDVDSSLLSIGIVRRVHSIIGQGGFPAAAQIAVGFGADVEQRQIAQAVYELHLRTSGSGSPEGGLGPAVISCAEFLQVMRAVGADRLHAAIDAARAQLINATILAAQREGSSSELANYLVKPLMQV
jgi:hypothetical protein